MQRMKGQMHCMLSTLQSAGRSLKKRCTVSRPKCICVQRSKMASKGYTHSCYFLLQRYRSARQSPVQNDVLGLERQLQIFHFLCLNMAALSFLLILKKWLRVYLHVRLFWHSLDDRNLSILFPPTL